MAARTDASLAALLLCQRLVDTDAPPLKASEYWALLDQVDDPGTLLGAGSATIAEQAGLDPDTAERVAARLDAATSVAFALEDLEQSGFRVVTSVDDDYPAVLVERLGGGAPPLLYLAGDTALLTAPLLGVVGSRTVAEAGAEAAKAAARAAVEHGHGVVSGGAKGVDRLAMTAALDAGGAAVGVLAESLQRAARDPEARRAMGDGRLCLCTPYKPTAGFSVASAMGRNKLIYALSQATLVIAADHDTGGTWAGAVEALRRREPVLVWTGEGAGDGNAPLVERGATPVDAIDRLFPLPETPPPSEPSPDSEQLRLGM